MGNKIYIPTKNIECWKSFLSDPKKHWKDGHSAKTLACCWEVSENFPPEIEKALKDLGLDLIKLLAIPEYQVYLDNKKAPSQNDLFVLARGEKGLYVIMIEGKVDESFDKAVKDWDDKSISRTKRLDFLKEKLNVSENTNIEDIRYQLLHRTVSAILTAEQFCAVGAIMLVHSFSPTNKWFNDYEDFNNLLSSEYQSQLKPAINKIEKATTLKNGIYLYLGWIKGDE